MAFISDRVFDEGLTVISDEANRLDVCSQEPTTYGEAVTDGAYSVGNKLAPTISQPTDRTPSGREVTVSAITDGTITETDTANYWALTDTLNTRLLAVGDLTSGQAVTDGNAFTLTSFTIGIPDPA